MSAVRTALRSLLVLSLAGLTTGCIVIPAGHRHHHGYAHVVVPVKVERRDERRYGHGRKHRDHRRHKNDWAPFNDGDAWGHPEDVGPSRR